MKKEGKVLEKRKRKKNNARSEELRSEKKRRKKENVAMKKEREMIKPHKKEKMCKERQEGKEMKDSFTKEM